jgi:predicted methyltransferase
MAKRKLKIHFRIPSYVSPRNQWRRLIYDAGRAEMEARNVVYHPDDLLSVSVVLYLKGLALAIHDVDNRLKDVLDALQGRMGGPKAVRQFQPLIPNDKQIFQATVCKMLSPPQGCEAGNVTITGCRKT